MLSSLSLGSVIASLQISHLVKPPTVLLPLIKHSSFTDNYFDFYDLSKVAKEPRVRLLLLSEKVTSLLLSLLSLSRPSLLTLVAASDSFKI